MAGIRKIVETHRLTHSAYDVEWIIELVSWFRAQATRGKALRTERSEITVSFIGRKDRQSAA